MNRGSIFRYSLSLTAFSIGVLYTGYVPAQNAFWSLLGGYSLAFLGYGMLVVHYQAQWKFLLIWGMLLRLALVFAFPQLSDDVYRFLWDGHLLRQGISPYAALPNELLQYPMPGAALYERLNSPEYYSVYPPLLQGIFYSATSLFPNSWYGGMVVMKLWLFLFEGISVYLLPRLLVVLKMPAHRSLLYALNPLILVELVGNLHFEGALIAFFLLASYALMRGQWLRGAVFMTLSVSAKLLPLIVYPFLIRRLGWGRSLLFGILTAVLLGLSFAPLLTPDVLGNFLESLDLYFRRFEFNGSLYLLLRWLGNAWYGYNPIQYLGPALGLFVLCSVLFYAWIERGPNWEQWFTACLFAASVYLLAATTVHPWYLSFLLVCAPFTRWRFPYLWSWLIVWSYWPYQFEPFREAVWVQWLEYGVLLAILLLEFRYTSIRTNIIKTWGD